MVFASPVALHDTTSCKVCGRICVIVHAATGMPIGLTEQAGFACGPRCRFHVWTPVLSAVGPQ
eukprot:5977191-Lingulodinium_polyedra.AAC.1